MPSRRSGEMAPHRKQLERTVMGDFAAVLESKADVDTIRISEYGLVLLRAHTGIMIPGLVA